MLGYFDYSTGIFPKFKTQCDVKHCWKKIPPPPIPIIFDKKYMAETVRNCTLAPSDARALGESVCVWERDLKARRFPHTPSTLRSEGEVWRHEWPMISLFRQFDSCRVSNVFERFCWPSLAFASKSLLPPPRQFLELRPRAMYTRNWNLHMTGLGVLGVSVTDRGFHFSEKGVKKYPKSVPLERLWKEWILRVGIWIK